MTYGAEIPLESVEEFKDTLKSSSEDAQYSYQERKATQSAQSSKHFNALECDVHSRLWINKSFCQDTYSKSQESEGLCAYKFGPFAVKKLFGKNSIRLDQLEHIKIHPIIHVTYTTPLHEQADGISLLIPRKTDPVPSSEFKE